jgi:hypothetical protein
MSGPIEEGCLRVSVVEPNELLTNEKTHLDLTTLESYDLIPISKTLTMDDVWLIKKVKKEGRTLYLPPSDRTYVEMRGGEWELVLFIVSEAAKDVVLGLIAAWIYDKVADWRKAKTENPGSGIKQPDVKSRLYFRKTKKYIEMDGDADAVLRALDKLKSDEF